MSDWISLKQFAVGGNHKLPLNVIIYRTVRESKTTDKKRVEILIPRQISTRVGIESNTEVDILFNPDQNLMKIVPLKEAGGFKVRAYKSYSKTKSPVTRVIISFGYSSETKLPITDNRNVLIRDFDETGGLQFSLDAQNESE